MNWQNLIVLGLTAALNYSFYTYKVFPKELRTLENPNEKHNAYVVNDFLHKEYKIMVASNIFNITTDSLKSDLKIKLYPLKEIDHTGDLSISLVTLGQVPVLSVDRFHFFFDEIKQDVTIERTFELKLTRRIWV